jgi:hypothetical protein
MRYSPGLCQSLASADDKTSSNGSSDGNHSNVTRLQTTVEMRMVGMNSDAIGVDGGDLSGCVLVLGLDAILGV